MPPPESRFHPKQWVRFYRPYEIYAADLIIPVGTVAQVIEIEHDGVWVRPTKRFPTLDEWLNGVQLWDWRLESNDPAADHAELYIEPADCPFD